MRLHFDQCVLDTERRELRRGLAPVPVQPQVFDLLVYLIENRGRVVSKDDLLLAVWNGRIVSESTLISRINAARRAIGDDGDQQRLIRTVARKGVRSSFRTALELARTFLFGVLAFRVCPYCFNIGHRPNSLVGTGLRLSGEGLS